MGEIVNLNRARKAKTRTQADQAASRNRVAFGRTKMEKAADRALRTKANQAVEAHKREP